PLGLRVGVGPNAVAQGPVQPGGRIEQGRRALLHALVAVEIEVVVADFVRVPDAAGVQQQVKTVADGPQVFGQPLRLELTLRPVRNQADRERLSPRVGGMKRRAAQQQRRQPTQQEGGAKKRHQGSRVAVVFNSYNRSSAARGLRLSTSRFRNWVRSGSGG